MNKNYFVNLKICVCPAKLFDSTFHATQFTPWMTRAWSQRGERLLSIHVGLFLFKPDLEKKNTFACSKQIKLGKVIQKSKS